MSGGAEASQISEAAMVALPAARIAERQGEVKPPSQTTGKPAAEWRQKQHRQRGRQQRDARHFPGPVERSGKEQRQVDEHGPIAKLDGGEQRANPRHRRCCEYTGIEHRTRTAPLLQNEQQRGHGAAGEAGGSNCQ